MNGIYLTQEEIQERNEQIALMLGSEKKNHGQFYYWTYDHLNYDPIKILGSWWVSGNFEFHSDWNWLMKAVEIVESKGYDVFINGLYCRITDSGMSDFEIESGEVLSKKDAVFIAVSDFAKLYNEGKP